MAQLVLTFILREGWPGDKSESWEESGPSHPFNNLSQGHCWGRVCPLETHGLHNGESEISRHGVGAGHGLSSALWRVDKPSKLAAEVSSRAVHSPERTGRAEDTSMPRSRQGKEHTRFLFPMGQQPPVSCSTAMETSAPAELGGVREGVSQMG